MLNADCGMLNERQEAVTVFDFYSAFHIHHSAFFH